MRDKVVDGFKKIFSGNPRVFQAPGRVNLIGEHTDYNDGFVFPIAIDRYVYAAYSPRADGIISIYSKQYDQKVEYYIDKPKRLNSWSDYVFGVFWALKEDGIRLPGANIYIDSTLPMGAGLSSSAALEVATVYAIYKSHELKFNTLKMALQCQKAENQFVGNNCGLMDQFISLFGRVKHVLFLDCRSFDFSYIPIDTNLVKIIVCNTMVKHKLAATEYNNRRKECEEGVKIIQRDFPKVKALRDVIPSGLASVEPKMSDTIKKRCRHVINENDRTVKAMESLKRGDFVQFGKYMNESHASLQTDYEVSCKELDLMVKIAKTIEGTYGARMTGGGFGGCTVNFVLARKAEKFVNDVKLLYTKYGGRTPEIYIVSPSDGASEV